MIVQTLRKLLIVEVGYWNRSVKLSLLTFMTVVIVSLLIPLSNFNLEYLSYYVSYHKKLYITLKIKC